MFQIIMAIFSIGGSSLFPKCFGNDLARVVRSPMCAEPYTAKGLYEAFYGDSVLEDLNFLGAYKEKFNTQKLRHCDNKRCGKKETIEKHFQFCKRCKVPRYCSVVCQKIHWANGHKQRCFLRNKV